MAARHPAEHPGEPADTGVVAAELPLAGPAGEPVDPGWTVGASWLRVPPLHGDPHAWWLQVPVVVSEGPPRRAEVEPAGAGRARVRVAGPVEPGAAAAVEAAVRRVLALDVDLSGFYALAEGDPALSWVTAGAGRVGRSPSVFEDLVKTVCTVNCSWRATHRMVSALVAHLGEPTADGRARAFPRPAAMAAVDAAFYRDVARAGYRAPWLAELARRVAADETVLEELASSHLADDELAASLRELPGVGPYAAAHLLQLLGRFSQPVLDAWTRPTYARLVGTSTVRDADIRARFAGYGPWAGLAFWLFCHQDPAFR